MDVKSWRGTVSTHNQNWHVQVKEEDRNFTNTHIEQIEDPLKAIMVKKKKRDTFSWTVEIPSRKPKCQTVWHTCVQGPINCPVHSFHANSSWVKRFWVTLIIYMEISNTTTGLSKLHKCLLFIWKAIIMFMRWGLRGVKSDRCLNTAVTLCARACLEKSIFISIDVELDRRVCWQTLTALFK